MDSNPPQQDYFLSLSNTHSHTRGSECNRCRVRKATVIKTVYPSVNSGAETYSIFKQSAEPSWILNTMATHPFRPPTLTSTPSCPNQPRKKRSPTKPSGCGWLSLQPLATLWW